MECGLALNVMVVLKWEPLMNKLSYSSRIVCSKPLQNQLNCGPVDCLCWLIAPFVFVVQVVKVRLLGSCAMQGMLEALDNALVVDA